MVVLCKHCENLCKKFGKVDCVDFKKTSIADLEKQRDKMLIERKDTTEIDKKLNYFYYGIL